MLILCKWSRPAALLRFRWLSQLVLAKARYTETALNGITLNGGLTIFIYFFTIFRNLYNDIYILYDKCFLRYYQVLRIGKPRYCAEQNEALVLP